MKREFHYLVGREVQTVTVERNGDRFRVQVGDRVYDVAARPAEQGQLDLEINGRQARAYVASDKRRHYVALAGATWVLERPRPRARGRKADAMAGGLEASMPGLVLDVCVSQGDAVSRGQTLVLLESMKMELQIKAPYDGRVRQVYASAGQVVERGQVLVEIEAAPGEGD